MPMISETITAGVGINDSTIKLKRVTLKKDYGPDEYVLDLTYTLDSPTMTQELHIPRMAIPLDAKMIKISGYDEMYSNLRSYFADLGFGEMRLLPDKDGAQFTIKTVAEKVKEMTLDEIEKKLGHKVKIVNKR